VNIAGLALRVTQIVNSGW